MKDKPERGFIDTNILVYAYDVSAGTKHEMAVKLISSMWDRGTGCLSVQVLQELYVNLVRKIRNPLAPREVASIIEDLSTWRVHMPGPGDILDAIDIHQRYRISFWDGMIICSARKMRCQVIWSEDLNPGQDYDGIQVLSPFG